MKRTLLVLIFLLSIQICVFAAGKTFRIELEDKKVSPGRHTLLQLIITDGKKVPKPDMPFVDGLDIRYKGSKSSTPQNGSIQTFYEYTVTPSGPGTFNIGPVVFEYEGNTYRSNEVVLRSVRDDRAAREKEKMTTYTDDDLKNRIFIELEVPGKIFYVNEKVPVFLRFYSDWFDVEDMNISEPLSENMIMTEFTRQESDIVEMDGIKYVMLNYRRDVFAPLAGKFVISPVKVDFKIVRYKNDKDGLSQGLLNDNEEFYESFLGRRKERLVELETDPVPVMVKPLPPAGRPEHFSGAVGDFQFDVKYDTDKFGRDRLIMIDMRVSGTGNFDSVNAPHFVEKDGLELYDPDITRSGSGIIFKQAVYVSGKDITELPVIRFTFFNPERSEYITIDKGPYPLAGGDVPLSPRNALPAKHPAPEGIIAIKSHEKGLHTVAAEMIPYEAVLLAAVVPVLFLISSIVLYYRFIFLKEDADLAVYIRANGKIKRWFKKCDSCLRDGNSAGFYESVFNIIQDYIGERFFMPPGTITEEDIISVFSIRPGLEETASKIISMLEYCYKARFTAAVGADIDDMRRHLKDIKDIITALNRYKKL